MNESSNSLTTRREFIKTTGRLAAASALAGVALPHVHAAGNELIQVALVGCGGRGTGAANNALASKGGPVKLVAMADVFEKKLNDSYEGIKTRARRAGGRAAGPQVHRLRRLQEGDGLPEAGRHRDSDDAAGVPLVPVRLRHREGAERVHGEARDGGRPDQPQDAQAGRGCDGQEPEGRRGADVPSQPGAAGAAQAHPGRRDRRRHPNARLPDARAGRARVPDQVAGQPERIAVAGPALPRVPVGQRRLLQRLLHPPH